MSWRSLCDGASRFLAQGCSVASADLGAEREFGVCSKTLEQDLERLFPDIQKQLLDKNQHDAEDWLSAVVHQNHEMLRILRERKTAKHHSLLQQAPPSQGEVVEHFTERAERYDQSSHWCTDTELRARVLSLLGPKSTDSVLDGPVERSCLRVVSWYSRECHRRGHHGGDVPSSQRALGSFLGWAR